MATEIKVIKVRRGAYTDFDKTKMNAGEPAVTTSGDPNALDGKGVYMGVGPGQVKQVAMIEDIEDILNNAVDGAVDEATQQAEAEADRAEAAATQLASTVTQVTTNTANIAQLNERLDSEIADVKEDLKQTEDEIIETAGVIKELECGLTEEVKTALLACFEQVAWIKADGQTYYDALETALNKKRSLSSISAVFTQGSAVIYDTDELYALKQYLTVTATYDDGTTKEVNNYTLSGELVTGISTITVAYNKKTTTFNVTVTHQAKTLESISATFSSPAVITTDNVLDDLRPYLTVRATYSDGSTNTVTNYTLSGSLNVGTNTITVTYSGKTATFTVNVTQAEKTLQSISAVFNQGSVVIYTDTPLNDLKQYLTVTGHYSDGTSQTITNYTLRGTLTEGTSTVTVSYSDKTTTFKVTVSSKPAVYLTMNDVDTITGYRNPVIQNGSVSCDVESTKTFSVFAIKPTSMPVKYNSHLLMPIGGDPGAAYTFFVFKKDGNDFYATDGSAEFKFTYNSGGYYDAQSVEGVTQKSVSGNFNGECVASIENGVLTITSTNGDGRATFTNANIFGYWGSAFYVVLIDNCEVNYNVSI